MTFEEEAKERGVQRMKHLEDPNYRGLSDVFGISNDIQSNYIARLDSNMLACYLTCDVNAETCYVKHYIEENIDNPEINWRGIFAYLDEREECQQRIQSDVLKREFIIFYNVLNPYRDKINPKSTFIGF
jgi:hypothetical protein